MKRVVLGIAATVLLAMALCCSAEAGAPAAPSWAVVDTDRVSAEYRGMRALDAQFQEFQKQQETQLAQRRRIRMLLDEEQREYLDLSATGAPTPERDKRLADLEKLSDERNRRLLELSQKGERTPEEEQEYQKLDQAYKQHTQELNTLQADAQKAVLAKYEELTKVITDSVNGAVKAVAEEKKLQLVLRKEMVLYGGLDITEDVIAKLNAGTPPEGVSQPAATQ